MPKRVAEILSEVLRQNGIELTTVSEPTLNKRRDEVLLMREVSDELQAVSQLVGIVELEYQRVLTRRPEDALATSGGINEFMRLNRETADLMLELSERAYGKVVTVKLKTGKLNKYRIAQANRSVLNGGLNVINRLAPVAGLLVSADLGDELTLPSVGEVEVVAIDLLDRSQDCDHRDFSAIQYSSFEINKARDLARLRRSLNEWLEKWRNLAEVESPGHEDALREAEEIAPQPDVLVEEIALGSAFYTRTTKEQEELVRRLHGGLVIVQGIAGSGKTSVALGRLKALHDSRFGDDEGVPDTFFSGRERMVGFVRHSQLIEYLKNAIDELKLSGIPVREFRELQHQLILQRAPALQLRMPGVRRGTYTRAPDSDAQALAEGSMRWLQLLDQEMLKMYAANVRKRLAESENWYGEIDDKATYLEAREVREVDFKVLVSVAWKGATEAITEFVDGLGAASPFSTDRLIVRVKRAYDRIFDFVEDRSRWYLTAPKTWSMTKKSASLEQGYQPFYGGNYGGRFGDRLKRIRDRFREQVRRVLHVDSGDEGQWLPPLSDWYKSALDTPAFGAAYAEAELAICRKRLAGGRLNSSDINALLAIAQIMSRDHAYRDDDQKRLIASLSNPRFVTAVFVDEVQDFSEIEVFLMASMADPQRRAITVVGDFMQQLYPGAVADLRSCFPYAQSSELQPASLTVNKRQVPALAAFSADFRTGLETNSISAAAVPEGLDELRQERVKASELGRRIGDIIGQIANTKSIAVISPTGLLAEQVEKQSRPYVEAYFREPRYSTDNRDLIKRLYVHFTEPRPTKGLEFDVVILTHFDAFNLSEPLEAHAAYVAVTRPREQLIILQIS
jgi:hypothetical protein